MILLKGGRVIDPRAGVDRVLDVRIEGERVAEIGDDLPVSGAEVVDCAGYVVCPGFVDLHVHFREPGGEDAETIESGSRAAAAGGFVAVCAMPNTDPPQDNASVCEYVWHRGREVGLVDVVPIGAITAGRAGVALAPMREMHRSAAGVRIFSDDGDPVPSAALMRRALEYTKAFDGVIVEHAEDPSMRDGDMNEGPVSTMLGLSGRPAAGEEICVLRDVVLARLTGSHLHIAHVSTAGAIRAVRQAKTEGLKVTCEVTPHHLALTEEALRDYDPAFKVAPPLRSAADVEVLKAAIADGTVDAIATDHAPHAPHTKDRELSYAPCGMVGLETALGVVLAELVEPGVCSLGRAVELLTSGPADILGDPSYGGPIREGAQANITVFDQEAAWSVDPAAMVTRSANTPFVGKKLRGKVVHTVLRGEFSVRDGRVSR